MAQRFCLAIVAFSGLLTHLEAAPTPCFVVGPVTFSHCQVSNSTSPGLLPMSFSFVPGTFNDPPGSNNVQVLIPGVYALSAGNVAQSVSQTLSADFSVTGYVIQFLSASGDAQDDGIHASENIIISSPCSASIGGGGSGNTGCGLPSGVQSGSLVVQLEVHTIPCPPTGVCDTGEVGRVNILIPLQPVPEAGGVGLMSLCLIALGFTRQKFARQKCPFQTEPRP